VIGRVINNYEIKSVVAEGGMGTVYLAEHPFMGRRVAVKVLRGMYLEDKEMTTRFMNEARAANAIHHPNIVEMIDVGQLQDGPPYLMMEFLGGETLGARLSRENRLTEPEAIRIIDQAAAALEAAHAAGIIHRDLKPDNLFLVPPEPGGSGLERVKIVDFGIAKLDNPAFGDSARTTGVVLGTPNYMSPEQCRGTGIDHRTDIYALGAILYEMLCGKPPFVSQAQIDVMMMHVTKVPTSPRELFPLISPHLESVALRALAKRPDDRFASMSELRAALDPSVPSSGLAIPIDGSLTGTPSPSVGPVPGRGRRAPWLWLAVVLGVGAGWLGSWRSQQRPQGQTAPNPEPALAPMLPAPEGVAPPPAEPVPAGAEAAKQPPAETARARNKTRQRKAIVVHERPPAGTARSGAPTTDGSASAPASSETSGAGDKNWMNKW
jgi:serine/threonine-protein kinase